MQIPKLMPEIPFAQGFFVASLIWERPAKDSSIAKCVASGSMHARDQGIDGPQLALRRDDETSPPSPA
jgi:hypothetical protein